MKRIQYRQLSKIISFLFIIILLFFQNADSIKASTTTSSTNSESEGNVIPVQPGGIVVYDNTSA